jgi:hypothetical protein
VILASPHILTILELLGFLLLLFGRETFLEALGSGSSLAQHERVSQPPITLSYDKENHEITNGFRGTAVSYTYSGDGLKCSEIGELRTTMIWDGTEYLAEVEGEA